MENYVIIRIFYDSGAKVSALVFQFAPLTRDELAIAWANVHQDTGHR